ncbi:MAG: hypothetical protein ABIO95_02025 [Bdellovibrionota bacterium]
MEFLSRLRHKHRMLLILAFSLSLAGQGAHADPTKCVDLYAHVADSSALKNFSHQSNLWTHTVNWELTKNFQRFQEDPNTVMKMKMVSVPKDEVEVITFGPVDHRILDKFVKDDHINWPQHPNNTSAEVPYFGKATSGESLDTRYTASRSLLSFEEDAPPFTIKVGTDFPHKAEYQSAKALTKDDIEGAVLRQPFLNEVEKTFKNDDLLVLLPEILVLKHKATGEGVILRDLSRLDNENIYVTGLSIPYVGRDIAKANGLEFEEFWAKTYGHQLGRAKARMLLNYGIEMETPNSQNILIELTKDMKPTGKVVIRDTVDSWLYRPWVDALHRGDLLGANNELGWEPRTSLNPYGSNSIWRFDEAGKDSFSSAGMKKLLTAHDSGWVEEMRNLLGITTTHPSSIDEMDTLLHTDEGLELIRKYHVKNGLLKL